MPKKRHDKNGGGLLGNAANTDMGSNKGRLSFALLDKIGKIRDVVSDKVSGDIQFSAPQAHFSYSDKLREFECKSEAASIYKYLTTVYDSLQVDHVNLTNAYQVCQDIIAYINRKNWVINGLTDLKEFMMNLQNAVSVVKLLRTTVITIDRRLRNLNGNELSDVRNRVLHLRALYANTLDNFLRIAFVDNVTTLKSVLDGNVKTTEEWMNVSIDAMISKYKDAAYNLSKPNYHQISCFINKFDESWIGKDIEFLYDMFNSTFVDCSFSRQDGGSKRYIVFRGGSKRYVVRHDENNQKYVHYQRQKVMLRNIRGKYVYVNN